MKKLSYLFCALSLAFFSCSNDENTFEEDSARLNKLYEELITYSAVNSQPCTNPDEWAFMKMEPGDCSAHIMYSKKIDLAVFQKKIDTYIKARNKFNSKWKILYDCMIGPAPTGIECVDNKPKLIFPPGIYN